MNDIAIPAPTDLAAYVATQEAEDKTRAELRKELVALGVATANIFYNGGGDEGNVEEIRLSAESEPDLSHDLYEKLSEWAWEFVIGFHSGFENNEGGFGNITWDMTTGAITLDHNDYIEHSEQTLHEGI